MAQPIPRKILRQCTIYVDRVNQIGQASEMTLPPLEFKTETILNAGMTKEKTINMYVISELKAGFKELAIDKDIMKTFGKEDSEYMIAGVLRDAEGGNLVQAVCYMRGKNLKMDFGSWTPGDKAENDYEIAVDYIKYEEDGEPVFEADDYDIAVGGNSLTGYQNTILNG